MTKHFSGGDETFRSRNLTYGPVAMLQIPSRRRSGTRDQILEVAEDAVLAKGFAATSIEEIIAAVGITKSGFFYHFRDKADLAKALIQRYLERDQVILDEIFRRGDELN